MKINKEKYCLFEIKYSRENFNYCRSFDKTCDEEI